ncbi:5-aminolevulic acid synthase [Tabrizicola oligotrophica]|uniref:5-aminolevulic acid synthase n=1 Tax=Tabrizicola oligotrophica TaxID=2710650 RepID=A0A6M0QQF9_9RHOB|nr:5-aminolevulic acid synthase [Tabrizicola oligotrophica]NEY89004.1 5-aminolevulic acid synthase [Tabrizicola oligotrophica]
MFRSAFALAMLAASPALAEPLTGEAAKALLFAPVTAEVEILAEAGLSADHAEALKSVGVGQPYYGAVAIAPDEGLMSEATVAAANFHDTASAGVAALAECDAKKVTETACVIAAYIRPEGWKEAGFSLSSDATAALAEYDATTGALAISPATGAFGTASGEGSAEKAVQNCGAKNEKATDCAVVIAH